MFHFLSALVLLSGTGYCEARMEKQIVVEIHTTDLHYFHRRETHAYVQRVCLYEAQTKKQILFALDVLDVPRPWLESRAYMERVYTQAKRVGATKRQLKRLKKIAHRETRENPRICVSNGCGPFQNEIHSLLPKQLRSVLLARNVVRFLLTNKPGFSATTALNLLRKCEVLSKEHWSCCYGGAYRHECRIKWDEQYRERQDLTMMFSPGLTSPNFSSL